jgi:phosphodiesterase/alkaline phosphatase D-like protein
MGGRVIFLAILAMLLVSEPAMPCVITSFSPAQATDGATLTLTGSGFTGATSVVFTDQTNGRAFTASFVVNSDTQMTVTVPSTQIFFGGFYITVVTNTAVTVTLNPTATIVGSGTTVGSGGSETIFVEAGGTATNKGSGSDTYYVQSGGTVSGGNGGGSNVVYAEPGATVSFGGVTLVSVASVTESPVATLFQVLLPPPTVTTGTTSNVSFSSATATGSVSAVTAQSETAYFQYGTTPSYGSQTVPATITTMGRQATTVTEGLTNLSPNTLYHYQLVAVSANGTGYGADATFTTAALAGASPGVVTAPTSDITYNAATLNAVVDPNGTATSAYFEYGPTASYGSTTTAQALGGGTADVGLQSTLSGLPPNTTYHYCVVATSADGTTYGSDQVFQTGAVGIYAFSPAQAAPGTALTLYGTGFTGATSVVFDLAEYGFTSSASFVVNSDTQMTVTVPSIDMRYGGCYITVVTGSGLTVTLNAGATVVENGSSLGAGAGTTTYIEGGGSANNNGGGEDTYYVKSGGTVNGSGGGGGNVAYAEPGATVTLPGVGLVSVPDICQSPIATLFQLVPTTPAVITGAATNVEFTDATANGTLNNSAGVSNSAYFEYGTTTNYGSETTSQHIPAAGSSAAPVAALLRNLTPNTLYHYQLVGTNSGGTSYGGDETFTTASLPGNLPGVFNIPASGVSCNTANLNAVVDPNGAATSVSFNYGLSSAYGSVTTAQAIGSGTTDAAVQASIAGLSPNTTYHFCVVATNANGTTSGSDETLQTGAVGISSFSPAQAAAGATLTLSGVGFTGATSAVFQSERNGRSFTASVAVISDTLMTVTVPSCEIGGGYSITLITSAGVTVTLDSTATVVENGSLSSSGGSAIIYVEGGGTATNNGNGGDTYYVKSGGAVNGSGGGGGNVAYVEPGASVTLPGVSEVPVADIDQSPVGTAFDFLAPGLPVTAAANNVTLNNATANGTVNAEGTPTTAYIQYGPESGTSNESAAVAGGGGASVKAAIMVVSAGEPTYPNQTPSVSVGSGTTATPVAVSLTSLTPNTIYHYRVVATNGAGTTYGADQEFTTNPAPFDIWSESQFTAAELENSAVSGATATPAGDGISNLMKYALGMNPMVGATAGLPVLGTAIVNGANCATFTYTKTDSATDITYYPEWSSDLSTWSGVFFHLRVTMP